MKHVLFFLLFHLTYALKVEFPLKHVSSLKEKWIRDGTWEKRLANFHQGKSKASMGQSLINYFDDFYVVQISLGTPPQTLTLRPDTGSPDLWVLDSSCTSQACKGTPDLLNNFNRTLFNTSASSTFKASASNQFFNMSTTFGPLCLGGVLASDEFTLPGFNGVFQGFGLCQSAGEFMSFHPFDGVLGLAWPGLSKYIGIMPVVQDEIAAGHFDQPAFSIWINGKNNGTVTPNGGMITWGGVDTTHCDSNINYVPVSSKTYWQFTFNSFTVGSYSMNMNMQAITSTGYTEMGLPSAVILAWLPLINGTYNSNNTNYYAGCDYTNYPSLVFGIGGQQYTIPPSEWISDNHNGTCRVRVFHTDGGFGPKWVLSTIWIRNYCVHHDVGNSKIGFSKSMHM